MKIDLLKPIVREKAQEMIDKCAELGINLLVTSSLRTFGEQDALYAQGRTKPGNIVTNAKGGQSFHNFGVAFDVVPLVNGVPNYNCDWNPIGRIGALCGLEWGDRGYVDLPHFQYRAGYSLDDFQKGRIDPTKFDERAGLVAKLAYLKNKLASLLPGKKIS